MKSNFVLNPFLVQRLMEMGATYKVRAKIKGHKIVISYSPTNLTFHSIVDAVKESYPHARMVKNERDGDFNDIVEINLNDK